MTAEAASAKNRRTSILPLRRELAAYLAELLARNELDKGPDVVGVIGVQDRAGRQLEADAPALKVPTRGHAAKMLRHDLAAARATWLQETEDDAQRTERERSDFLTDQDDAGRVCPESARALVTARLRAARRRRGGALAPSAQS